MSTHQQRFVADILDASGNIVGPGPLFEILSVEVTEELDRGGQVAIVTPATDERVIDWVATNRKLRVRVREGTMATFIVQNMDYVGSGKTPTLRISGPDLLGELLYLTTGYNRTYNNLDLRTAVVGTTATSTSLLGGTGWTQGTVENYGNVTIEYDAQTRLAALITLAEQLGRHIRQGSTEQTLDFGLFGSSSGCRITNVHHALLRQSSKEAKLAYVAQAQIGTISADIENRILPLGKSKFDMRDATNASANIKVRAGQGPLGATTLITANIGPGTNPIPVTAGTGTNFTVGEEIWIGVSATWATAHEVATVQNVAANSITLTAGTAVAHSIGDNVLQRPQFYVEDTASQASYGVRENTAQFNWIGPIDATILADRQQAADMLYAAVNARLTRHSESYRSYILSQVVNLPYDLRVGEKVRLTYRGNVKAWGENVFFIDIDDEFYVIKITRKFAATGAETASVAVANVSRPTPNNTNLVLYNLDTLRWVGLS
ncbi:MAG: hypothetical protein DRI81_16780 [Chloroflexi bacterium]|nr:MAG: hypothetical protein DRI81_16780 [Chloroflexota bacterium]